VSSDVIYLVTTWAIPVIVAITFHEAAHGFVAHLLGDDTAWRLGRVSFNPAKHIDPFGTILLPGMLLFFHAPFLFGYAKPVPVNFQALRWPRRDMVLVAAAGPAMNIALAVVAALSFHIVDYLPGTSAEWLADNLKNAIILNVVLAVFNLSAAASGWWAHLGRYSSKAYRRGSRAPGALRIDDSNWSAHHVADAGCSTRRQPQLHFGCARDRHAHNHQLDSLRDRQQLGRFLRSGNNRKKARNGTTPNFTIAER